MRNLVKHFNFYRKRDGVFGLFRLARKKALSRAFNSWEWLYCADLLSMEERGDSDSKVELSSFDSIEDIEQSIIDQLRQFKSEHSIDSGMNRWFQRGAKLWIALQEGKVVGLLWSLRRGMNGFYSGPIGRDEVIVTALEIFPFARGKSLCGQLLKQIAVEMRRLEVQRIYLKVESKNSPMIRAMDKAAFAKVGEVYTFNLGKRKAVCVWNKDTIDF